MKRLGLVLVAMVCAACATNRTSGNTGTTAGAMMTGGTTAPRMRLEDDREVAMIVRVANLGEVREGTVARTKATAPAVKEFAAMMVSDHGAAEDKAETALTKADLAFVDSDLSRRLDAESGAAAQSLAATSGDAFDRAYMDRQIAVHTEVLQTIDSTLMPQARKKELRAILTEMRTTVQQHLDKAKLVRAALH
jgi:putative membrane protein